MMNDGRFREMLTRPEYLSSFYLQPSLDNWDCDMHRCSATLSVVVVAWLSFLWTTCHLVTVIIRLW